MHNHINASVVAAEGVCGYASKQGRVGSFGTFDAQVGQYTVGQDFLAYSITRIALRVQSLVVHVPQDTDWFLALRLALQHSRFTATRGLISQFNLELRRR